MRRGRLRRPGRASRRARFWIPHAEFIFGLIAEAPDITLEEIADRLADERAVKVVATAVWKFLDRRDMTHKKKTGHASEQERADVKAAREQYWLAGYTALNP